MATAVLNWPLPRHDFQLFPDDHTDGTLSFWPSMQGATGHQSLLLQTASSTHQQEQTSTLKLLLEAGADTRQSNANGDTSLHLLIAASQPDQPWLIESLILLLQAGADPTHVNNAGLTVFDLACAAPLELGSFRRDLLLRALLETDGDISDVRLLRPTRLTRAYCRVQHHLLFGNQPLCTEEELRTELLDCLDHALERHNIVSNPKLQETALDRVLSSHTQPELVDPAIIVREALTYLHRMCECKKQIVAMSKQRIPRGVRSQFGGRLKWLQTADQAQTTALLGFDWLRPVDTEDVFSSYVDTLIEQVEDWSQEDNDVEFENLENLTEALQNTIPSYRALSIRRAESKREFGTRTAEQDRLRPCVPEDVVGEERGRQESIVKTPIEFYSPEF